MSRRVLVVEDDEQIREVLAEVLTDEGYAVETAENGRQALERLDGASPCVMLLDLMMPVMNGWQLLGELRADGRLDGMAVVVVSAAHDAEPLDGVRTCLRKPITVDRLLSTVKAYCG